MENFQSTHVTVADNKVTVEDTYVTVEDTYVTVEDNHVTVEDTDVTVDENHTERNKWYILTHFGESGYCLQINPNYQVN